MAKKRRGCYDFCVNKKPNLFVEIHKDFWSDFKAENKRYATEYFDKIVNGMIECGDPQFGYIEYGCMHCGSSRHVVGFTCKTHYCLRCSRVFAEKFVDQLTSQLVPGMVYRHLILTMPKKLVDHFFIKHKDDPKFLNAFYEAAWDFIQDVFSKVTGIKNLKCGCVMIIHLAGRDAHYHPHLHILVMNGGLDLDSGRWVDLKYFPYKRILPKKWQFHLLSMIKKFGGDSAKKIVNEMWEDYPKGFVNRFKQAVPKHMRAVIRYLSRYLARPMISANRILKYDKTKNLVEYEYLSHETDKIEIQRVSIFRFIGRMVQQVLPKWFQRIRYFGLQATKDHEKWRDKIKSGKKSSDLVSRHEEIFKIPAKTYADRLKRWTGHNPLICPKCKHMMEVMIVWTRNKGVVFDLLEVLKRQSTSPPDDIVSSLMNTKATDPKQFVETVTENMWTQLSLDLELNAA